MSFYDVVTLKSAADLIERNAGALKACNTTCVSTRGIAARVRWDSQQDRRQYEREMKIAVRLRAMAREVRK